MSVIQFVFTWDTVSYPNGLHEITAQTIDQYGNVIGDASLPVTLDNGITVTIERSTDNQNWDVIAEHIPLTAGLYHDDDVEPLTHYYYRARIDSGDLLSAYRTADVSTMEPQVEVSLRHRVGFWQEASTQTVVRAEGAQFVRFAQSASTSAAQSVNANQRVRLKQRVIAGNVLVNASITHRVRVTQSADARMPVEVDAHQKVRVHQSVDAVAWSGVNIGQRVRFSQSTDARSIVATQAQHGVHVRQAAQARSRVQAGITSRGIRVTQSVAAQIPTSVRLDHRIRFAQRIEGGKFTSVDIGQRVRVSQSANAIIRVELGAVGGFRLDIGPPKTSETFTIAPIISGSYRYHRAQIGEWEARVPVTAPNTERLTEGLEVRIVREGEGTVFRGILDDIDTEITEQGMVMALRGDSVARELIGFNTLLGREFDARTLQSTVNTLLSGTGWTAGTVQGAGDVTARFEGVSIWEALDKVAESQGVFLRERPAQRVIDIGELGNQRTLRFVGVESVDPDMVHIPIQSVKVERSTGDIWTRVIPLGGGEQLTALTLERSTRFTPYSIRSATGPDGQTYWYLQDDAAAAEFGVRTRVLSFKDIVPLSNSAAEVRKAANALYDLSASWLRFNSKRSTRWEIQVSGFRHRDISTNTFTIMPGDRVPVNYHGVAEAIDGYRRLWVNINEYAWVHGIQRRFSDSGDDWVLELSDMERLIDQEAALSQTVDDMWAIATSQKHSMIREIHGPYRQPIDNGKPRQFQVEFDGNVRYLHKVMLSLRRERLTSTTTNAEAGGGGTTPSGGGHTGGSGGSHGHSATNPSAGSNGSHGHSVGSVDAPPVPGSIGSHGHIVSGQTTNFHNSEHDHVGATTDNVVNWTTPPFRQHLLMQRRHTTVQYGMVVGRGNTTPGASELMVWNSGSLNHAHGVTGWTTSTESSHRNRVSGQSSNTTGSHSHTMSGTSVGSVPNHTHPVNDHTHQVPSHTHPLVYGIYEHTLPSNPGFQIWINGTNRTSALGGPFNNHFSVDITQFLVDFEGQPLRQNNTIEIRASNLQDIVVTVKSLVTIATTVPI